MNIITQMYTLVFSSHFPPVSSYLFQYQFWEMKNRVTMNCHQHTIIHVCVINTRELI